MSKITRLKSPRVCTICKVKNAESFILEEAGENESSVCSVCLSLTVPDKMNPEARVGFLPLKQDQTRIISLLLRAVAQAQNSGNAEYQEKAEKIKAFLEQTINITLAEKGSDDVYDLAALIKDNPCYFPINQDDELLHSLATDSDLFPSVTTWKQTTKKMTRSS